MSKWSNKEILVLKKYYKTHGTKKVSKLINRSRLAIKGKARNLGLKYELQNNHLEKFQNWENPYLAYTLGFAYADGSVRIKNYKDRKGGDFSIGTIDYKELSPIFNNVTKWSFHERFPKNKKPAGYFNVYGNELCNWLWDYLEFDRKSYSSPTKILNVIPEKLVPIFFRGYVDGDGFIEKIGNYFRTRITSCVYHNWDYLQWFLKNKYNLRTSVQRSVTKSGMKSNLSILGSDFLKIIYETYNDDKIGLKRKADIGIQSLQSSIT